MAIAPRSIYERFTHYLRFGRSGSVSGGMPVMAGQGVVARGHAVGSGSIDGLDDIHGGRLFFSPSSIKRSDQMSNPILVAAVPSLVTVLQAVQTFVANLGTDPAQVPVKFPGALQVLL